MHLGGHMSFAGRAPRPPRSSLNSSALRRSMVVAWLDDAWAISATGFSAPSRSPAASNPIDRPRRRRRPAPCRRQERRGAANKDDPIPFSEVHSITSSAAIRQTKRYGMCSRADHSALMLAARITLPHFSVSSATSFPNSAGVIGMGSPASSARRVCNFGSANTAFTA
jgi:hypothetical protein